MRKQNIGEGILRLLMTPDHAAAVVGDLNERGVSPRQFRAAIGSNILHAINREVLIATAKGFLAQYVPLLFGGLVGIFYWSGLLTIAQFQWVAAFWGLGGQVLTGYWLTRRYDKQPVLICALIVIVDCVVGLLRFNNASINMALWAIPLLISTVAIHRRQRRKSIA